ncbi:hypothetical protein [Rhizobium sp. Root1220]|uniref:hypothetical protein n=1 Tax=Rhizobium sp. Root1220 TaxID=1736432 RepID=UPI0006FFEE26|nr:hypothetical protein [Rhizobium sp. Root1220]KQV68331.1 hypothetical protein ASC90_11990 [Rhizobium sp. Root1220]
MIAARAARLWGAGFSVKPKRFQEGGKPRPVGVSEAFVELVFSGSRIHVSALAVLIDNLRDYDLVKHGDVL